MGFSLKLCDIFAISIIGSLLVSPVLAMDIHVGSRQGILVFDQLEGEAKVAKQYRVITDLRVSGSGQFSADELYKLLVAIPTPKNNICIVDLRQESHGFIDGIPVSWVKNQNASNRHKSAVQIKKEENNLLADLSKQKSVTVYSLKKLGDGNIIGEKPVTLIPELVESEQQLVTSLGAQYKRIYVLDHNKPDDQEVDNFIVFIRKVKPQDWLHFHCRAGKGRTSTFIAMYDIIRNAQHNTFIEIMRREAKLGNVPLNKLPTRSDKLWKSAASKKRYEFLKKFYIYIIDPSGYQVQSWSSWNNAKNSGK